MALISLYTSKIRFVFFGTGGSLRSPVKGKRVKGQRLKRSPGDPKPAEVDPSCGGYAEAAECAPEADLKVLEPGTASPYPVIALRRWG